MESKPRAEPAKCHSNDLPIFTPEHVYRHNKANDFYTIINQHVYNLSSFHSIHPGGSSAIMNAAGTDATILFNQYKKW